MCKSEATMILVIHPQFSKTFLLEYRFEEIQTLRFVVYDVDDRKRVEDARRHDLIGEMECTLADIVTGGQLYKRTLRMKGMCMHQSCIPHLSIAIQDSFSWIQPVSYQSHDLKYLSCSGRTVLVPYSV